MSLKKEALIIKFKEIFNYEAEEDFMPKSKNARKYICQGKYKMDELIKIFDTSVLSNGKTGLVLTKDSVCVKDSANYTSKFIVKYEDINKVYLNEEHSIGSELSSIDIELRYGKHYQVSILDEKQSQILEFIEFAKELYL